MVQQNTDSKISERGEGNTETDLPSGDEELTVVGREQTASRDSQNSNAVTLHDSLGKSPAEDIGTVTDTIKLCGTKRATPECPENPSQHRSPNNNSTNGQLVYVRRKSEADLGKNNTSDNTNVNTDHLHSKQIVQQPQATQPVSQIKEPKVSCFPAFAPFPMTSSVIPPGKPLVPQPVVKSATRSASAEPDNRPRATSTSASRNLEVLRNLHWEARYNRLQTLLKKLDQRPQEGYVSLLRQLTARELSGHAVELEKRSMQLSLDEAKELKRVEALNMLAKPSKSAASQGLTRQARPGK